MAVKERFGVIHHCVFFLCFVATTTVQFLFLPLNFEDVIGLDVGPRMCGGVALQVRRELGDLAQTPLLFSFIIHMCIQGLGHFSPLPPSPPLPPTLPPPSPPHPLNTQQKLFCPYF
jgi:hypothetical protein